MSPPLLGWAVTRGPGDEASMLDAAGLRRDDAPENLDPPAVLSRARAAKRQPHNLPPELTSFIGRGREIAEVRKHLEEARLLTLTGPGGCGKTRLALRVAADVVDAFESGVWWVELASLADPDLVPQTVARALGVHEAPDRPLVEVLVEYLEPGRMLLVLNNCEHLIDACAALVETLMRGCPNLRVLATSREALGLAGETAWLVPSLSTPEPRRPPTPGGLARYEAVRLFVERTRAVVPDFAPTEANAPAVAALCRRLDGVPLAIELAAARMKVLTVGQILARLDDSFGVLRSTSRSSLPRHQTLRATIDWSHVLLPEAEQALFRRLSVFVGGFTLSAAEAVCAGDGLESYEVLDLLSGLADKSLVLVAERDDEARYRMLETVRQYGREKLEGSGEELAVRRRHAGFFLDLAEEAEPALLGPEQGAWLERLEVEHDNLRAALGWFAQNGDPGRGFRLGSALWRFWWLQGHFTEGRAQLEALLELPGAEARTEARAKALYVLGVLACRQADYAAGNQAEAHAYQQESLEIYRELRDEPHTAEVLRELGRISIELGNWATASSFLEESLRLERESGSEHGVALTLNSLGWLAHFRRENAVARPLFERARATFRELRDDLYADICLFFLGRIATDEGDYAEAHALLSATVDERLPHYPWVIPPLLEAFAGLGAAQGQAARALRLAGAATALRESLGVSRAPAWRADLKRRLEPAWRALDEGAGAAAWEEGKTLAPEEAVAFALEEPLPAEAAAAEALPELRLFALGPARVEREGRVLATSEWTYAKPRELLFYLLSHPPRTKEQIGLALWPDASAVQLRRTFHVTLHHLRRALGGPGWIVYKGGRYAFDRSLDYWFDVEAFEKGLAEARRLRSEAPALAIRHLEEAVGLYGGDFLEDFADYEWASARQEELRRTCQEALIDLGGLLFDEGRYAEAADAYRRIIARDNLLEAAHRGLMRCYARLGERGQALKQYESLAEVLREELGSSPAPETKTLLEQLSRGEEV